MMAQPQKLALDRRTKLTPDQVTELAELREQGWSIKRLAMRFGVSRGAVYWRCLSTGAFAPGEGMVFAARQSTVTTGPKGRSQRRFTIAEDRTISAMRAEGVSVRAIAGALGRGEGSIKMRLLWLGKRAAILEATA